jgi:hypothetical protein
MIAPVVLGENREPFQHIIIVLIVAGIGLTDITDPVSKPGQ